MQTDAVYPLLESQRHFLKPLLNLLDAGKISLPGFTFAPAHKLSTEVFILAARRDEAVDYRTSIALAYSYPHHELFIANDNHVFTRLNEAGLTIRMLRSFLKYGMTSREFVTALNDAEAQRWVDR